MQPSSTRRVVTASDTSARPYGGRAGGGAGTGADPASRSGLLAASAPPLLLPAEHFAAALAFWVAAAIGLVWVAPDIAQGLFPLPRVVAVAHLLTLGWITTSIMGALYQFLPVALQVQIRSAGAAHAGFALYVPGLALFVGGSIAGVQPVMLSGAALFGTALLMFVANLAATLRRAPDRNLAWWALAGAAFFLFVTVVLGSSLAGNLRWGYLGADRFTAIGVHLHVAVTGWVMLVVVGVAHRLLPMFLLSHGASELPGRLALGLLIAGNALLMIFHHWLSPAVKWTVGAILAAGLVSFLVQARLFFRSRRKPALDPGLRLAAAALGFIGLAVAMAPFFLSRGLDSPRLATAYVAALLLGGVSLFVAGIYYKIVPFLVWFHRFGPLVGRGPVPRVYDLYSAPVGHVAAAFLATGAAGLVLSTLTGTIPTARPSAALFAAGALTLAAQMIALARRRPR